MRNVFYISLGLFLSICLLTSCDKTECGCGPGPSSVSFMLLNQDSVAIFDSENFDKERVRFYKEVDGVLVEFVDSMYDHPTQILWDTIDGHTVNVQSFWMDESFQKTIYISYLPNDIDTIDISYHKRNNTFDLDFNRQALRKSGAPFSHEVYYLMKK